MIKQNKVIQLVILMALIFNSCQNKNTVKLQLLFETNLNDNGGKGLYDAKIGLSDNVFHIENYEMAKAGGYIPIDTVNKLWFKGLKKRTDLSFEAAQKKFATKRIDLNEFLKKSAFSDSAFYRKNHILSKKQLKNGMGESFIKVKRDCYVQLVDSAGPYLLLKIYNKDYRKTYKIKSFSEINSAQLKSIDIDGDGIKEIFVISTGFSYWGAEIDLRAYKLEWD